MATPDKMLYGFIAEEPSYEPTFLKPILLISDEMPEVYFLLILSGLTPGANIDLNLSVKAYDETGQEWDLPEEPALVDGNGSARLRVAFPVLDLCAGEIVAQVLMGGKVVGESRLRILDES